MEIQIHLFFCITIKILLLSPIQSMATILTVKKVYQEQGILRETFFFKNKKILHI
jgi:hypothetical protein